MTFEELKKAEWTKLGSGIEYISIDEGKTTDSVRFEIMPVASLGNMITGEPGYNGIVYEEKLLSLLNKQIPTSQNGYLRIEPFIFLFPDTTMVSVYLDDMIMPDQLNLYMDTIRKLPGVRSAYFLSKNEAREKYLGDGNQDWKNVLTDNPLPASIEVAFNTADVTGESMKGFKKKILSEMIYVKEVSHPSPDMLNLSTLYMRYKRF
jgi:hypothetical protein